VWPGPINELGNHIGGVGFDLMLAFLAPDDQADVGSGSVAERHR